MPQIYTEFHKTRKDIRLEGMPQTLIQICLWRFLNLTFDLLIPKIDCFLGNGSVDHLSQFASKLTHSC